MFKAVLFDMDGVIVDTEPLHHKAYFMMFDAMGINVSEKIYQSFTGQSTLNVCSKLCNIYKLNKDPQELVDLKRHFFGELFTTDPNLKLIDGVLESIQEYHDQGLTLVLASSASMMTIERVFERFDLDQYFVAKLSGADLKESKPHPEIFLKAAEVSGHPKEACFVIEDSTNGIRAAHKAGIYCVAYRSLHSGNQDYRLADIIVDDFKEVNVHALNIIWNGRNVPLLAE